MSQSEAPHDTADDSATGIVTSEGVDLDNLTEEEQIEVETGAASSSSAVVQLGDIPEVKDIVESSDC